MGWIGRWARHSQERALGNARGASTALSRLRVEREEVELFLQEGYASSGSPGVATLADARAAGGPR
jgi:hypothetical protein